MNRIPFETWIVLVCGFFCVLDLLNYIGSWFRKSSVPADDK